MAPHARSRGFIALISAIVISTILLALATSVGQSTFFTRFDELNSEYKRISFGYAEACANAALAKIADNYNYTTLTDPGYDSTRGGAVIPLGTTYGQNADCVIKTPSVTPPEVNHKRTFSITTSGKFMGAFSTIAVSATMQNPSVAPVVPPPTCVLTASPASFPLGQSSTLQWSTSANATSMSIDHNINAVGLSGPPWQIVTPPGVGAIKYIATVSNAGGSNTCEAVITVTAPPPAPACADTVMVFDRTGSMGGSDLANERTAGNALITLYAGVSSFPRLGAGSFGGLDGSAASIPANGVLTSTYTNITSALSSITGSNSSVGSNLAAAIQVADTELGSIRHILTNKKVFVFVSDGEPNQPGSTSANTGTWSPTAQAVNASSDAWTNATNAYADSGGDASDTGGHRNRFYNFNLPTIPTGSTIGGITVGADAWSTPGIGPTDTGYTSPSAQASDTGGANGNGFEVNPTNAYADGGGSAGNNNGPGDRHRYYNYNIAVPAGAPILGIEVRPDWWLDSTSGTNSVSVELSWDGGAHWTAAKQEATETTSDTNGKVLGTPTDLWGHAWTTNDLTNGNFRVRITSNSTTSSRDFFLDWIPVKVFYSGAQASSGCQLGVDLSYNGGTSWTTEKVVTLGSSESTYTLGTLSDTWGRTWGVNDFTNTNFRARVHDINPGGSCGSASTAHLDWLRLTITYTQPSDPSAAASLAAANAKANGVSIFTIHFGDTAGQNFLGSLASPSSLPSVSIVTLSRASNVVTVTTATPHRLAANERVTIAGVAASGWNGTFMVISIPSPTTFTYSQTASGGTTPGGTVSPTNLFIAPASSAMAGIFQSIGTQICPAAAPACSNTADDDGDGLVDEQDPGCHTDGNAANAASYNPADNDEWTTPAIPPAPAPPPPPPNITLGSWQEVP